MGIRKPLIVFCKLTRSKKQKRCTETVSFEIPLHHKQKTSDRVLHRPQNKKPPFGGFLFFQKFKNIFLDFNSITNNYVILLGAPQQNLELQLLQAKGII